MLSLSWGRFDNFAKVVKSCTASIVAYFRSYENS